jgi:hypothetical protein
LCSGPAAHANIGHSQREQQKRQRRNERGRDVFVVDLDDVARNGDEGDANQELGTQVMLDEVVPESVSINSKPRSTSRTPANKACTERCKSSTESMLTKARGTPRITSSDTTTTAATIPSARMTCRKRSTHKSKSAQKLFGPYTVDTLVTTIGESSRDRRHELPFDLPVHLELCIE